MKAKALEVRDANTFIPVLAVDVNPDKDEQVYLLRRCGYACDGRPNIILTRLDGGARLAPCDPYDWADRTFMTAHTYIIDNWHRLKDGDVVDVEWLRGETSAPKLSERYTAPL